MSTGSETTTGTAPDAGAPRRVAVVGAGPAGVFTADALVRAADAAGPVSVDLLERLPAPFGLVRYGVAPDHPRIKRIITALSKLLARGDIRLLSNVELGADLALSDLRQLYDAVVLTTGANRDAALPVPGVDLPGSYGAADFVAWYGGHPDGPRSWPLDAAHVAVVGAGNVALDVSRMLVRRAEDLLSTDVPDAVHAALAASAVTDVHVLARRGPAQARFSAMELRELGEVAGLDVVVDPADLELDDASRAAAEASRDTQHVLDALAHLAGLPLTGATRRLHLHFWRRPVRFLGPDAVSGVELERTEPSADGRAAGTGELSVLPVQAVYRAVGYRGSPVPGVPFDEAAAVVPNHEGRVLGPGGDVVPGLYASGWIKRGPVGLIGHTKSDAAETVASLAADLPGLPRAPHPEPEAVTDLLQRRGVRCVDWSGWMLLDAFERELGAAVGRERIKVADREEMLRAALRAAEAAPDAAGPGAPGHAPGSLDSAYRLRSARAHERTRRCC